MFGKEPKVDAVKLDEIKLQILDQMLLLGPGSEEFTVLRKELEKITKLQKAQIKQRPDSNTILLVVGNLFGILIIVVYEQKHVFASTARNFILKAKT